MSTITRMPAVFLPPFTDPRTPLTGRVTKVHRRPGHYAGDGDPVLDVEVGPHVLSLRAPFDGKVMRCRGVHDVLKAGDYVFETTAVGKPTWEVFVSYRRADAPGHTGRIGDRLLQRFGPGQVFKDIECLLPGEDFATVVRERLRQAYVMVIVIGPRWHSDARLHEPDDLHREEIRTALERGIEVVPVLVDGATMPIRTELPEDIRSVVGRQGIPVPETYWDAGVDRLVQHIESALEKSPRRRAFLGQVPSWDHQGWQWVEDNPAPDR